MRTMSVPSKNFKQAVCSQCVDKMNAEILDISEIPLLIVHKKHPESSRNQEKVFSGSLIYL